MAFKKLARVKPTSGALTVTFHPDRENSILLKLSVASHRQIGEPAAIHFEWDDDESLLRIVASNPEDPAAYLVRSQRRVGVTGLPETLGVDAPLGNPIPVNADGPLALIADLSDYVSAA